ncbi:MAG TPA: IS110 family transposase [Chitinophagaceae bacterium]|nr:IS110 family transposase [Chitinophagaceae bacterium]
MKSQQLVCGIDVSKLTVDVYYNDSSGKEHYLKLSNDREGHLQLISALGVERTYVMESSGPYYMRLAFTLKKEGADVRVGNPIVIKRFIQMRMERNKSDKKDAKWIYRFAQQCEVNEWKMPSRQQLQCSEILSAIDLYNRQMTMICNQLESLEQMPCNERKVINSLQRIKSKLKDEIKKLEQRLEEILKQWHGQQLENLSTVPGLGKRAVALLIVYTDGFRKIQNHRQLTALCGLAPREYTSGTSVRGKKGICKMGNGRLRNVLYMCSMSAIKHNKACTDLYERLKAKGKNGKVALIAVCNKLLKQAFAIATSGIQYQANYKSSLE